MAEIKARVPIHSSAPPKRRWRNYLLDPRFQLKYTGMVVMVVVLVTLLVGGILGHFAYKYSKGQTESLTVQIAMQPDLNPEAAKDLEAYAKAEDQKVAAKIISGLAIMVVTLAFALGATGIVVTHRVVGPAYRIKRLLKRVARGQLNIDARLREGDELQDVFEVFERMVEELRARQADEIAELDRIIESAKTSGVSADVQAALAAFRSRMQSALD